MSPEFLRCFLPRGQIQGLVSLLLVGLVNIVFPVSVVITALDLALGSQTGRDLPWSLANNLGVPFNSSLQFGMG